MNAANAAAFRIGTARTHHRSGSVSKARVADAARRFAHGVDDRTADERTHDFYRSSGMEWSRSLK